MIIKTIFLLFRIHPFDRELRGSSRIQQWTDALLLRVRLLHDCHHVHCGIRRHLPRNSHWPVSLFFTFPYSTATSILLLSLAGLSFLTFPYIRRHLTRHSYWLVSLFFLSLIVRRHLPRHSHWPGSVLVRDR